MLDSARHTLTFTAIPGSIPVEEGGFYPIITTRLGDEPVHQLYCPEICETEEAALVIAREGAVVVVERFKRVFQNFQEDYIGKQ